MSASIAYWTANYLTLRFEEKGRGPTGVDCWGLTRLVLLHEYGVELPMLLEGYNSTTDTRAIARLVAEQKVDYDEAPEDAARQGDLVLFRVGLDETHVGVVVGPGLFLHVTRELDVCVERWRDLRWSARFIGIFRHKAMSRA